MGFRKERHSKQRSTKQSAFAPAVGVKPSIDSNSSSNTISKPYNQTATNLPLSHSTPLKSALVHLLSGGLAAGIVRASLQPLDTCKTRLQATRLSTYNTRTLTNLLFSDGIRGLYRGVIPGVIGIVPAAAVYMLTFQTLKSHLSQKFPRRAKDAVVATSAGIGDVAASLVRVPCEVLKQRLQIGLYPNISQALISVTSNGVGKLYSGLGAQLARDVPYAAMEFVVYENLKAYAIARLKKPVKHKQHGPPAARIQRRLQEGKLPRLQSFLVGGSAGAIAAIVSNPMDVVKTRLMTQVIKNKTVSVSGSSVVLKAGNGMKYRGVVQTLMTIAKEEGVGAFAKGIAPRIATKTLQSAMFFAAYEGLRRTLSRVVNVNMNEKKKDIYD